MKKSFPIVFSISLLILLGSNFSFAGSASLAKRTLPTSASGQVLIKITPQSTVKSYAVEETLPKECQASEIDNNGRSDQNGTTVKWGIFFDHEVRTLAYKVTCPEGGKGNLTFKGLASFDGKSIKISGHDALQISVKTPASN